MAIHEAITERFILIWPDLACWVGDGEEIPRFCGEFLGDPAQSDVQAKLAGARTGERHAIIIATSGQFGLHTAVNMSLTSSQAPGSRHVRRLAVDDRLPGTTNPGCYWTRKRD